MRARRYGPEPNCAFVRPREGIIRNHRHKESLCVSTWPQWRRFATSRNPTIAEAPLCYWLAAYLARWKHPCPPEPAACSTPGQVQILQAQQPISAKCFPKSEK